MCGKFPTKDTNYNLRGNQISLQGSILINKMKVELQKTLTNSELQTANLPQKNLYFSEYEMWFAFRVS